ncbi:MAG: hypothetical protein HGA67_01640 [Candidatus Yonathbacteria bacterium]|nr:hypothetical protein [Candidatus Yonathbacteria bacterium]
MLTAILLGLFGGTSFIPMIIYLKNGAQSITVKFVLLFVGWVFILSWAAIDILSAQNFNDGLLRFCVLGASIVFGLLVGVIGLFLKEKATTLSQIYANKHS